MERCPDDDRAVALVIEYAETVAPAADAAFIE